MPVAPVLLVDRGESVKKGNLILRVDSARSEKGEQRRVSKSGRLLHCCCVCGVLNTWRDGWSAFCSMKQIDDGEAYAKFCSLACRQRGGKDAANVTSEMIKQAWSKQWRDARLLYREDTQLEKFTDAAKRQTCADVSNDAG